MNQDDRQSERRILIVKLGAVGDCVHTLYVLRALRERFPKAVIGWAVEEKAYQVVAHHPDISHCYLIPRKKGFAKWFSSLRPILTDNYDTTIDLSNLLKSGIVSLRSGAKNRIGFARLREANFLFNNIRIKSKKGHMIERYFKLLESFDIHQIPMKVKLEVAEHKKKTIDLFLRNEIPASEPVAVLNPHGTWPNKLYTLDGWAYVADQLAQKGCTVILAWGSSVELERVRELSGMVKKSPVIAPPTDLKELYYLFTKSTIYLGNDSGPMHLAAAAGIGVSAVFGPTNPERVGPWCERRRIITAREVCDKWPCEKRRCPDPVCITKIDPVKVAEETLSLIEECR